MSQAGGRAAALDPLVTVLGESDPQVKPEFQDLLETMRAASDRSAGSDELASLITDPRTEFHLSPARANLLIPLSLGRDTCVLDFGCGTGALSRAAADMGAHVVGLDDSFEQCQVAAARLAGMPNAAILCGSLAEFLADPPRGVPRRFDLILCGDFGRSDSGLGDPGGPQRVLRQLAQLLTPGGVIALSAQNPWGLQKLVAEPEVGEVQPLIGVEGYWRGAGAGRGWSGSQLRALVEDSDLHVRDWYAAIPDGHLPIVLARTDLFDDEVGRTLVKQFVRTPLKSRSAVAADPLLTFQSAVDAGLGIQTANAFLMVVGNEPAGAEATEGKLWLSTAQRRRKWRCTRELVEADGSWSLRLIDGAPLTSGRLSCSRSDIEAVVPGTNAEDALRPQYVGGGLQAPGLRSLLAKWAHEASSHLQGRDPGGTNFDVMPNNFIIDASGAWTMVDTEFTWHGPVEDDALLYRALWYTAERLARAGRVPGIAADTSGHELTVGLAEAAGIDLAPDVRTRWGRFEAELARELFDWTDEQAQEFLRTVVAGGEVAVGDAWVGAADLQLREQLAAMQTAFEEARELLMLTDRALRRQRLLLEVAYGQVHELRSRVRHLQSGPVRRMGATVRRARERARS